MSDTPHVLVMDLGGVACRWLPDRRLAALADLSGLPAATIDTTVFESGFDDAADRGQFGLHEVLEHLGSLLALSGGSTGSAVADETQAELRAAWSLAFEPDLRVLDLVMRAECASALFTNNGPLLELALDHELGPVGDVFDHRLFSWRLQATKPDRRAFEGATAALGVDPARVLFVDDSEANVDAARAHGWQAHHYRDPLNLHAALDAAGVFVP